MMAILATNKKKFAKKQTHWCYYYHMVKEWVPLKKNTLIITFSLKERFTKFKIIIISLI
jgi:hypothetical protein